MVRKLFSLFVGFFQRHQPEYPATPDEINGLHDCALRALHITLPEVQVENIVEAFGNCCEWWPYQGVTNKEFNIVLSYLKIKDRFEYMAPDATLLCHLLKKDASTFIALIHGHYTIVCKGYILEQNTIHFKMSKHKVYCYWRLKSSGT